MTTLTQSPFADVLDRLFGEADASEELFRALVASESREELVAQAMSSTGYRALYAKAKDIALAVSRETATLLYMLARSSGARSVVEFGTSFGISTLHLAAAVRDNGGGRVITTEFEPSKVARARSTFDRANVLDIVELRAGDAIDTLANDLPETIDFVLLDGAKPLYEVVLDRLEPRLRHGALICADNADWNPAYLQRVRDPARGYMSVAFAEDIELSMRL
jgi:predicted O-methyltransferase YrrM